MHSTCLSGAMVALLVVYVVFIVREEPIYITRPPVTRRDGYYNVKDWIGGSMCSGLLNNGSWTRSPVSVRCVVWLLFCFCLFVMCAFRIYIRSYY